MDKLYAIIPKRNIIFSLICLAGVLVIVFVGIIPEKLSSARFEQKMKNIQFQIEEQKNLYPIYHVLKKGIQTKDPRILPFPEKSPLLRTQMDIISTTIKEIARKANLETVSSSPDVNVLGYEPKSLPVNIVLRGDYLSFRKFLIGLGEMPYLERIEEIQIRQNEDMMEFKMKILLFIA
jgi:Tfp pilus assembly protein PilO